MQNFSRVCVTLIATVFAIMVASKLDKFLALMGSLLCAPLALGFPALAHYKLLAKTWQDKTIDLTLFMVAVCIFFFCSTQTIMSWSSSGADPEEAY